LIGGAGNDRLYGYDYGVSPVTAVADTLMGGAGDDYYSQYGEVDNIIEYAGEGYDTVESTVDYILPDNVEALALLGFGYVGYGNPLPIVGIGNAGANTIIGNEADNILSGLAGNDTLTGGEGTDKFKFSAGDGEDIVTDLIAGETVEINGYASAQSITQSGSDVVVVLSTNDSITFQNATVATVQAALQFIPPSSPTEGDDTLDGTSGDDVIDGLGGNDMINGLGGADSLDGGAGNDSLTGGDGNDRLDGGSGDDAMAGGAGQDKYFVDSPGDTITELLGEGSDTVHSSISWTLGANLETLILDGTANINGTGNTGTNVIRGNSGANSLSGGGRGDRLYGNGGNDTLHGGNGADLLEGGAGQDLLIGSTGADKFVFRNGDFAGLTTTTADRIADFSQAEGDTIDLGLVDADSLTGGDQAFTFIGTGAFTSTAGELRYQVVNTNVFVYGDTNGDGAADFMIRLANFTAPLTESDFVI
jgi:Ca2+-binding RTX toxin-like protein